MTNVLCIIFFLSKHSVLKSFIRIMKTFNVNQNFSTLFSLLSLQGAFLDFVFPNQPPSDILIPQGYCIITYVLCIWAFLTKKCKIPPNQLLLSCEYYLLEKAPCKCAFWCAIKIPVDSILCCLFCWDCLIPYLLLGLTIQCLERKGDVLGGGDLAECEDSVDEKPKVQTHEGTF